MNTAIFFELIALISFVLDKMKDGKPKKQNTQNTRKLKKNPKASEKSSQEIKRSNEFKNSPKKNNKETVKKVKQKKVPKQVYKEYNQRDNRIPKHESSQQQFFERKTCVIVDKEKEIFSNSLTFDKEKIVNDIIFSEILSKPKSKR